MNEHQQNEAEKIELFLEHYELIDDLTETFDARWEEFSNEWGHRFAEVLEEAGYGQGSDIEERVSELELTRGGQTERWMFRAKNSDWAHIFKEGWWRRTDNRSAIMARPDDRNDARVGFYHRLEANRDLALRDETLRFTFRNMGANDDTFIAAFNQALESREGQLARNLPDVADLSTITKTRRDLITAEYSIRPDQHEDFFVAYLAALRQAFCDFVVERRELISLIDEAYIEALEIYEE